MSTTTRFVDESLVDGLPDAPRLVGSACRGCGTVTFPAQGSCPRCAGVDVERTPLATAGTLWSYTIQGFPPKEPFLGAVDRKFRPFGVGYVDLGNVIVETRIVTDDLSALRIGMPVHLVLEPFFTDGDGTTHVTYAFATGEAPSESK